MNATQRVMMLIDADNVSTDVIEQALQRVIEEHGAVHVRRAYCTPESALKHQKLLRALSIRPMVNLSTGKNSTDIALAVDAIDLVISERPDVVVIVSSDSDFAPLVSRLREKGCRVLGIGQVGKTGGEAPQAYDGFIDLVHRKRSGAVATERSAVAAASKTATKAAPAQVAIDSAQPTAAGRSRRRPARKTVVPALPVLPEDVLRILDVLPELREGGAMALNLAAERLRAAKLLSRSGSSAKLFAKNPELFTLMPQRQPHTVHFGQALSEGKKPATDR